MLQIKNLSLRFGKRVLFENVNIEFKENNCYGVIGANGAGKSTFLKIITEEIEPSTGEIIKDKSERISYLKQNHNLYDEYSVIDTVIMGNDRLYKIMKQKEKLYMKENFTNEDGIKVAKLEAEFESLNGWEAESDAATLLAGLGINNDDHYKKMSELKDKDKVKVLLAQALFGNPDILLLDEPTNHLDINTIEWLEEYLNKYNGTIVVVSHDRYFLDKVTNKTILIENGKTIIFHCNYSKYLIENEERIEREFKEYKDQQKLIMALKKKIKQLEEFGRLAYPGGEPFYKRAENIRKRLEKLEKIDRPIIKKELPINFDIEKRTGKDVLTIIDYNLSIENNELIKNINIGIFYDF